MGDCAQEAQGVERDRGDDRVRVVRRGVGVGEAEGGEGDGESAGGRRRYRHDCGMRGGARWEVGRWEDGNRFWVWRFGGGEIFFVEWEGLERGSEVG